MGLGGGVDKFFGEILLGYAYRGFCLQEELSVIRLIVHIIIKSIEYLKIVLEPNTFE